jgi:hypothetical protein
VRRADDDERGVRLLRDLLKTSRRRRVGNQAQLTSSGWRERLLHRRERVVGDLTDELLVLAAESKLESRP